MKKKIKPYAEQGHYTNIHDALFDVVMPTLNGNEWKTLCYILRKTRGWQKDREKITFRAIIKGTGIGSYSTVQKALERLEAKGHIIAVRGRYRSEATTYQLNTELEIVAEQEACSSLATETVASPATENGATVATETVAHEITTHDNQKKKQKESREPLRALAPNAAKPRWGLFFS